jgi:hypothetical protein
VPCVASLDALHRSVSEFVVTDLDLVIEPAARAAARRSLDSSGLLLLAGYGQPESWMVSAGSDATLMPTAEYAACAR